MAPAASDQQPAAGHGMDTVEYGLERLELAAQKAGAGHSNNDADTEDDGGHNRASWEDAACITDVDPLSVDLPAAIAHMAGLVERIQAPPEAAPIVEQLVQWAAAPRTETVDEVLDRISALLLVEGLGQATTAPLQATHGPAEWADGQLTLAVAAVFRPLLVDLVARSTQPEAQAAVLRHLGLHADADRARLCVAYAAGCLLHTTPQIRSLLADYFGSGVGAAVVSQAQAAAGTDAALHALVVLYRLLRVLPGAAGSTEAPLAALMAPGLPDLARLVACECLCLARSLSDQGRSQLVATLQLDAAVEAHARAWLVRGEQMFAEAATAQMVEQNRIGLAQGLWQAMPSNRRDWMDASMLSSSVTDVGGVLLHARGEAAAAAAGAAADLVMTPTVARNVRAMALAASRGEPVLLQGAVGSGKTSLVEWMARRTGNELVTVHLSGSMDAKVLVGSYVTTQRAGDFEWRAGLLTTAVAEGKWMLIENVDLAPPDVIQTLLPLVESHTLFVASRGESIAAHARFRLFATLSAHGRSRRAGASGLLGSSTWSRLEMGSLEAEYPQIIAGAFPALADDAEALARAFRSVSELAECGGGGGKSAPPLSTRDLARWCARLSSDGRAGDAFRVFQEAIDTFAVREPDHDRWCTLVQRIGVVFGIPTQRADQFLAQHSPAVVATGRTLKIGRAVLATDGRPAGDGSGMPFADTRHARCLLERIAAAVQRTEPVLLVGETGTGKTTAVQRLASLAGRELSVFNLSQQSDASDLLGGFRPVDVARVALQLRETFDSLFARTLSVRKNAAFLDRARGAFGRRDWKRLAALYRAAVANARQMIASAQAAVAVAAAAADTGGGHGEAASEAPRAKRPRLVAEDVGVLEVAWDGFERRLADFEAVRSARLAFHFAEGALVRAARAGGWILLDEVNLAAAETLACLGGVLQRERALLLAETGVRVECHPEFRLFACMNPANDVGKRDLPPGLRSGFTEIFVHPPDANTDDLLAIVRAHLPASVPPQMCHRVIAFYRAAKALAAEHRLADGAGQRPHYSLRTLARSLTYAREHAAAYSLQRSLHDGLAMTFATQLEAATQAVLMRELAAVFDGSDVAQMLRRVPPGPPGAVLVQGFWLAVQDAEAAAAAAEDGSSFVVTASVETKLQALARAAMCGRYPVLIQGPTSAGKTSMVHHLARCTGHRLVRINNHEHTDLQEYLGAYASVDGRLEFREGLLVQALRHGHWLVLDELNLAPSDVLEALNRLLDDNRELVVPETQEVVRPHPHFMLFATQNPAGLYGGRKALSRAFRSRFVELHFDDIPEAELQQIIVDSCRVPPTHARLLVDAYRGLTQARAQARIFEARHGFVTLRDLFRWAGRRAATRDELAEHGFMLLAERTRTADDKQAVRRAIERAFYGAEAAGHARARRTIDVDALYSDERLRAMPEFQSLRGPVPVAWTRAMRRLFILVALCLRFNEPVLLVGETGCGKTTVCQLLAVARGQLLHTVNCHRNTEAADILGSQRPVRACGGGGDGASSSSSGQGLFAWHDGPLVQAMRAGTLFLMDELNLADDSVLERLNSVLEPARTLVLAEHAGEVLTAVDGFAFAATMNPGGDYGKRELSPALRNRFTELWAPETTDVDDLRLVVSSRLHDVADADRWADVILAFVAWLRDSLRVLSQSLSLRDYLFWADFITATHSQIGVHESIVHGACLVLLDAIGAQGSALTIGVRRADAVRAECVRHLRGLAGWNTPALGVEPARELAPAGHAVVRSDGRVGVAPFLVAEGALGGADAGLALDAPTTLDNAVRVLRAMQVGRPLLLEGSPGVGKTALVGALARLAGQRLVRINLSDQTDLMDLFGTDLPSGDGFAWCDAPFLQALQRGDWVLLDEINLASQSVLEGLNSCLDHRGTVYIAELDREFALAPGFRLFAAQNPLGQGGGRKGLPRSFVNRFTQVHVSELRRDDLQIICDRLYGGGPSSAQVLEFNRRMHDATMGARAFGAAGAPWEFNLRDVSRLMQVVLSPSPLGIGPRPVDGAVRMLYEHRMRTGRDRQQVRSLFHDVFGRPMAHAAPTLHASEDWLQVGGAVLPRRAGSVLAGRLRSLRGRLAGLESLAKCVEMQWMAILVGAAGAGKTALVRWLAATTGNKLVEVAMNSGVDTSEILGGFEQVDAQRHRSRLLARARATVDRLIGRAGCSSSDAALATHASALYEQALACEDRQQLRVLVGELAEHAGDTELDAAAAALAQLQSAGRFEWVDGILVEALERGWWLLIDRANLCSAAVLDRLNGLLEPGGVLHVNEDPARAEPVAPHPDFRIFMAVDPQYGELSRAMRNRGVEICLLPDADDGASVTEAAGLPRALLRASSPSSSLAEAAQLAAQAAERVQRGGAVQAESCDAGRELCPLEPRSRDITVAVAGWQAQLVAAAAGESSGVRRERMLLAALGAVAPRPHAPETRLLSAIIGERPLAARLLASTLDEPIMRARQALAQVSGVHDDVLAAAPACLALNGGLTQALARHAGDPAWKWHATLLDALRFWRERAAAEELCPTDDAGMREQVLQCPGVDILHAQACFALVDGCVGLVDAWESQTIVANCGEAGPALPDVRTVHRLQTRLRALLARECGTASEEAVALEGIQCALARLAATAPAPVGLRAGELAESVVSLVLDATRSARIWALCHPMTLAAEQARQLEAQLSAALGGELVPETRAAAVEALALLYAAGSRRNGERIVEAVARFAQSLPPVSRLIQQADAAPADVLTNVAELAEWRGALQLTILAGCLPSESAQRLRAMAALREQMARLDGRRWPVLQLRLSWAAHDAATPAELLSLFSDVAFEWCGEVRGVSLGALVDEPAQRMGRAVATELAWKGAAHLQSPLAEHDRVAAESRALCRAAAVFRPPAAPEAADLSVCVGLLLVVATACDARGPELAAAAEQLVAQLATASSACAIEPEAESAWRSALLHATPEAADILAPAAEACHGALAASTSEQRAELACVALAEAAICMLGASVPARPVDPAAKAHTRWAWLGEDAEVARADAEAHEAVQRSMAGEPDAAAAAPFAQAAADLEHQRAQIALVHRPADGRFGELWREVHTLAATLGPRARDICRRLREAGDAAALDAALGAELALRTTLAQFEHRVATRHFAALRDVAQIWCLCARLAAHALARLAELRRRAAGGQLAQHAGLAQLLYTQPMRFGVLAAPGDNARMRQALDQLKVLIYTTPGADPARAYGELLGALLSRAVLGVQVRGTLDASELEALDTVFRDAHATHKRAADEKRRRDAEAASLFRHRGTAELTDDEFLHDVFPGYEDVFAESADADGGEEPADAAAAVPGFQDVAADAVAAIAACHRYVMLRFGVLVPAPDVQPALVASAQRRALQLVASLRRLRPELPALLEPGADGALRGANLVAAATVARAAAASSGGSGGEWEGVRAEHVYDFYRGAAPHEAVLVKPVAAAIAARAQELLAEWPEHAVLQRIEQMAQCVLRLPVTAPLAQLLTAVEQLHAQAQDWEAYASRDVSIAELQQAAKLIVRWRQAELNSWPHLLRAQELQWARRADEWWFGLYAALVAPEAAELADLVAAVDQFMQGSPAGEFRARLNMLCAFKAHRAALLAARAQSAGEPCAHDRDTVLGPLANAVDYYAQYAPCIAQQLETAKAAISKDLSQYVRISSWTDVNPAALRASAEKTHRHLARCVRRWRDALSQPIFQIVQAHRAAAVASARIPRVSLVPLPLSGAGLDVGAQAPTPGTAPTALPWTATGLDVDAAVAGHAARLATTAGVPRVLEASADSLARLVRLVAASSVLGPRAEPLAGTLERFAEDIVGDISHFQAMETPKHLVKRPSAGTAEAAPKARAKRVIKSRQARAQEAEAPAYVEDDEERQRQLKRFWGEQRNLRRTRMKDILRGLQEIGLKRHRTAAGDEEGEAAELKGLAAAMGRRPLDVATWRDALAVVVRASPETVHQGALAACDNWQLASTAFFHLTAQLAQLRSAAHEEHSQELSAQQTSTVVALVESLGRHVAGDREAAAATMASASAWIQAAVPWTALPSGAAGADDGPTGMVRGPCLAALCAEVEGLVSLLEQFFVAVRAVGDADGWGDSAALVARVVAPLEQAAPRVARARTMLADARAAHVAAQLAGTAAADAAALLTMSHTERAAVQMARDAVAALQDALLPAAESGLDTGLLEPWLQPILSAVSGAEACATASAAGGDVPDDRVSEAADLAGQWVTAVMNVWQTVTAAERQFADAAGGDPNAWGLVPKELLHRTTLVQQLARALHLPAMLALCNRLSGAAVSAGLLQLPQWRALATRVVRPWVVQYSLIVQHVLTLYAGFHQSLVQFALTTATCLASVVIHGLGATDVGESEEVDGSTQDGMGVGEGSTAGAKNVSDEIEGEDQVEGLQGDQDPEDNNDPATNEDAVEMSNDFDGKMGDADLETDNEDSDDESSDDEDKDEDQDEKMGDVDPTDPTSLDDKLWDDKDDAAQNEKDDDNKVDSKAQSKKEESDIVAGDEKDEKDDGKDNSNDPEKGGEQDQDDVDEDMSDGSGSEDRDDGDLDDRVNQDTLDRMADAEDVGEQLEMPEDLDMGGSDEGEESMSEDDGIDADMGDLPDDEPIEQKPDAMDEDSEERTPSDPDDGAEGQDANADDDEDGEGSEAGSVADSGDEAADDESAGASGESDAEGSDAEDDESGQERAMGEDAPEEAKQQHSGADKPTHGVDSAMNMDGAENAAPDTAADDSRDALEKPSDASNATSRQLPRQGAAEQDAAAQQDQELAQQQQQQQQDGKQKPAPERTLADVIEKWERRLNIVMRDDDVDDADNDGEQPSGDADDDDDRRSSAEDRGEEEKQEPAPEASEFEHVGQDENFDKVALADADEKDRREYQPMDIDAEDTQRQQPPPPQTEQDDTAEDGPGDKAAAESEAPVPNPQQRQPPGDGGDMAGAAQMLQAKEELGAEDDAMDLASEDGRAEAAGDPGRSDGEDANDAEAEDQAAVDVEQLREELEQATAAWRADPQGSGRAVELWQAYTRLTHELSLMLTEQLRLILTPTQATQLRGDYRTGKRLNMKRIIPYIASEFRKDKIWLRRTKPARREYQVMVALDNSKSMAQTPQAVELAYETLALVTTALNQLEVGQLSVVSFGAQVNLLHAFDAAFDAEAGAHVLSRFTFTDDRTDVVQLMDASLQLFEASPAATEEDLWRLQLVISDGVCQDHPRLLRQVRAATEQRVMTVFIVLDRSAIAAGGGEDPEKDSIMNTQHVSFVTGADGRMEMKVERYLDTFPFKYYVVLRDIHGLPAVLAETLRQYFSLMN